MVLLAADRQRPIADRASGRWTRTTARTSSRVWITDRRDVRLPRCCQS